MVTRVRIEAEGRSPDEVTKQLETAHERFVQDSAPSVLRLLFGDPLPEGGYPGLADAQAGEFVIERFARDCEGDAGHGAIVYRGRMTAHFAAPSKVVKLDRRADVGPNHDV